MNRDATEMFGLTAFDKRYFKVRKDYSKRPWYLIPLLLLVVVLITIFHFFVLPLFIPVAHAQEIQLTDRQQETIYCAQWKRGMEVKGATNEIIKEHCDKYLGV